MSKLNAILEAIHGSLRLILVLAICALPPHFLLRWLGIQISFFDTFLWGILFFFIILTFFADTIIAKTEQLERWILAKNKQINEWLNKNK